MSNRKSVVSLKIAQKDLDSSQKEIEIQINENNAMLAELSEWGIFPEIKAIESIRKILNDFFGTSTTTQRVYKKMNGESIEMDAFGYENSVINTAVVVEVKSHLREDGIEQIEEIMKNFPRFFPDHADKKLYGMIACVHAPENLKNSIRKKGIYLAVLHDEIFELQDYKDFTPKDFNHL